MNDYTENKKLQKNLKIKGHKMQQIARSKNAAIYRRTSKLNSMEYVVCLIYRIIYDISTKCNGSLEYFLTRESGKYQTIWTYKDYNTAFNQFGKLVKESITQNK